VRAFAALATIVVKQSYSNPYRILSLRHGSRQQCASKIAEVRAHTEVIMS